MRNRAVGAASRPFLTIADRILGARFLQDIAEFFTLMQSMEKGFVDRFSVSAPWPTRAPLCVVTTLETAPAREAAFFVEELHRRGLARRGDREQGLPRLVARPRSERVAARFCDAPDRSPRRCRTRSALARDGSAGCWKRWARASPTTPWSRREAEQRTELAAGADVLVTVPVLDEPVNDLAGLVRLGRCCWR